MFYYASSFNQNISNWCVTNIASEPDDFSTDSPLIESNTPVWGTCPSITAIPDANFEQALIDLNLDSGEIDGQVLTANISDVTSLIVNNKNIESLTGIEDFTALTLLWCFNNQITSLDLSANTALNTLYCHTNQLTSLDLSANPTLEYLTCYDNQLTSLDIRNENNESIQTFWAYSNPDLSCIFVDNPSDSNDSWQIDPDTFFVADEAECEALSIADPGFELGFSVYPNPTDNYLFIGGNKTPASISIYNLLGKKVLSAKKTHSVGVKELSKGVYFIRISDGMGQTNIKFIKN